MAEVTKAEPAGDYPPEEGCYLRGNDYSPVVVIVVLALVGMLVVTRRSRGKEPEPIEEEVSEEDRKKAFLSEMAGIAGEAADDIEKDIDEDDRE